jgi:hypothetical protein
VAAHACVPAAAIFTTGLFDFDRAQEHPLWAKELYGFAHHVPEGVARRPEPIRANLRSRLPMRAGPGPRWPLRLWLAEAALPGSPESALRIWRRALDETGSEAEALARCDAAERATLAREPGGFPAP